MSHRSSKHAAGARKPAVSRGHAPKSPRLRHAMKRNAEADIREAPPSSCAYGSIPELMKTRR